VVAEERFADFDRRCERLSDFLTAYGWEGSTDDMLRQVRARIEQQIRVMRETAAGGDPTYQWMLNLGRDGDLQNALQDLAEL
jgi:hypothetical protein